MNQLTHKQRRFAEAVARGCSYSRAYREVYSNRGSRRTTHSEASRLANQPRVAAEIEKLSMPMDRESIREAILRAALQECRRENALPRDRLKAVGTLAKLAGILSH